MAEKTRILYLEAPSTSTVPWSAWGRRGASRATLGPDEAVPRTNLRHRRRHRHQPRRRYFPRSHWNQSRFHRRRRCQSQKHRRQRRRECSRHCQLCHRRGPGCSAIQPAAVHGPPLRHLPVATAVRPLIFTFIRSEAAAWKRTSNRSNYYYARDPHSYHRVEIEARCFRRSGSNDFLWRVSMNTWRHTSPPLPPLDQQRHVTWPGFRQTQALHRVTWRARDRNGSGSGDNMRHRFSSSLEIRWRGIEKRRARVLQLWCKDKLTPLRLGCGRICLSQVSCE